MHLRVLRLSYLDDLSISIISLFGVANFERVIRVVIHVSSPIPVIRVIRRSGMSLITLQRTLLFMLSAFVLLYYRGVQGLSILLSPRSKVACAPATWSMIVAFYLLNYDIHIITVKFVPQ